MTKIRRTIREKAPRAPGKKDAWDHNPEDIARHDRRKCVDGHYINCQHYQEAVQEVGVVTNKLMCGKFGERETCLGCGVCPRCGGKMRSDTDRKLDRLVQILEVESSTCVICGEYYESRVVPVKFATKTIRAIAISEDIVPRCKVVGCKNRVWDEKTVAVEGELYAVCESHLRQMRGWYRRKNDTPSPLLITAEGLGENPQYKRQALVKGR